MILHFWRLAVSVALIWIIIHVAGFMSAGPRWSKDQAEVTCTDVVAIKQVLEHENPDLFLPNPQCVKEFK